MNAKDIMHNGYTSVDTSETISHLLGKCRSSRHFYAVITDAKGNYVGMADKHQCLSLNKDATKTKVKHVLTKGPTLKAGTDIKEMARLFLTTEMHGLPVVEKKKVIGIVYLIDVINALSDSVKGTVDDVNTKELIVVKAQESIGTVVNWFKKKGIGRLPVVDAKNNLVGICTVEDVLYRTYALPHQRATQRMTERSGGSALNQTSIAQLPASNLINSIVWTVSKGESLKNALTLMQEHDVNSLVIAEKEKPVGVITAKDILRHTLR